MMERMFEREVIPACKELRIGFVPFSPLASGLPDEILTLGTWLRPLLEKALPEDRHVDRVRITPDSPQEDEIPLANMQMHSIFHALYFPKQFVALAQSGIFFEDVPARDIARWQAEARRFAEKIVMHQAMVRTVFENCDQIHLCNSSNALKNNGLIFYD